MNTQIILSMDEKENRIVTAYAKKHKISKGNAIKAIILDSK